MRIVIQRISHGEILVGQEQVAQCGPGLAVFLAIARGDTELNADYLVAKIQNLRIFEDDRGKMNRSIRDVGDELLVVSEFTLYGDCDKGARPSFSRAAAPADAVPLYAYFVTRLKASGLRVVSGVFQARMKVTLQNDGPVTLVLDK